MQKVLITGVNGFVGQYLSRYLINNYHVIGTGRGKNRLNIQHPHFEYLPLDFTDHTAVSEVLKTHNPAFVVHAGAMSKPDECEVDKENAYKTNVQATKYLLQGAKECRSCFTFLSTDFIFDGIKGMYKEDDAPSPVNYYGQTKLEAENFVKNYPFDWNIVRTVLVYGDPLGGRENILTNIAAAIKRGEEVKIFDDQVRTPTYVEDLAAAIKTVIDRKQTGIYHISGKDVLTPYQMAVAACHHLELVCSKIRKITEADLQQPARRPLRTGFDITKSISKLDYSPLSFKEGLIKTFENYEV